jgi:hypothetical protein
VAQWIAHQTSDLGVGGSSPPKGCKVFLLDIHMRDNMAEWLRRQPAKLMGYARVGSNPTVVESFFLSTREGNQQKTNKKGVMRESNTRPLAP